MESMLFCPADRMMSLLYVCEETERGASLFLYHISLLRERRCEADRVE